MPVTLFQPLPKIAFSRNEILFIVSSDDYLLAAPALSVNVLEFTGAVVADVAVILTWTYGNVTMTSKDAANESGNQFPTGDGGAAYVNALKLWFEGNSFIDRDFLLYVDTDGPNPKLLFVARTQSPDYDFTPVTFGTIDCSVATPGVTNKPKSKFMHHEQLWIEKADGTDYIQALNVNNALDEPLTGNTTMDIGENVLHGFLSPDYPELNGPSARCRNSIRHYYGVFGQFFGTDPSIQRIYKTDKAVITMGGLGTKASQARDIFSELRPDPAAREKDLFLRQGSKNKMVRTDQPEWLTYINLSDDILIASLEVTIYNDGDVPTVFDAITDLIVDQYAKFQFQAGFSQLDIYGRQAAGKKPVYYTCRLRTAAGYITAAYNYVIEYAYREWPRYFVYFNSYGAYQTIATTGRSFAEYDRTKDDARLASRQPVAAISGDFLECNIRIQEKGTINMGYPTGQRNTRLLRDFALSPAIFAWEDGKLIPIGLNTTNLKDAPDGENVYASAFEYYIKYEEVTWTEEPQADVPLNDLLNNAGAPVIPEVPGGGDGEGGGTIVVEAGDERLSVVGGFQVYSNPYFLAGKTGYRIKSTQLGTEGFFRTEDITYDPAGSFKILLPGFVLQPGDQLIIWPLVLINP